MYGWDNWPLDDDNGGDMHFSPSANHHNSHPSQPEHNDWLPRDATYNLFPSSNYGLANNTRSENFFPRNTSFQPGANDGIPRALYPSQEVGYGTYSLDINSSAGGPCTAGQMLREIRSGAAEDLPTFSEYCNAPRTPAADGFCGPDNFSQFAPQWGASGHSGDFGAHGGLGDGGFEQGSLTSLLRQPYESERGYVAAPAPQGAAVIDVDGPDYSPAPTSAGPRRPGRPRGSKNRKTSDVPPPYSPAPSSAPADPSTVVPPPSTSTVAPPSSAPLDDPSDSETVNVSLVLGFKTPGIRKQGKGVSRTFNHPVPLRTLSAPSIAAVIATKLGLALEKLLPLAQYLQWKSGKSASGQFKALDDIGAKMFVDEYRKAKIKPEFTIELKELPAQWESLWHSGAGTPDSASVDTSAGADKKQGAILERIRLTVGELRSRHLINHGALSCPGHKEETKDCIHYNGKHYDMEQNLVLWDNWAYKLAEAGASSDVSMDKPPVASAMWASARCLPPPLNRARRPPSPPSPSAPRGPPAPAGAYWSPTPDQRRAYERCSRRRSRSPPRCLSPSRSRSPPRSRHRYSSRDYYNDRSEDCYSRPRTSGRSDRYHSSSHRHHYHHHERRPRYRSVSPPPHRSSSPDYSYYHCSSD